MIHRYSHRDLLLIFFADDTTEEQLVRTKEGEKERARKKGEEKICNGCTLTGLSKNQNWPAGPWSEQSF